MFNSGDSLKKGIRERAAAIKNIMIEPNDTSLNNFNKITYNAMQIKKIYMLVINNIPNELATAFPPLNLAKQV